MSEIALQSQIFDIKKKAQKKALALKGLSMHERIYQNPVYRFVVNSMLLLHETAKVISYVSLCPDLQLSEVTIVAFKESRFYFNKRQ